MKSEWDNIVDSIVNIIFEKKFDVEKNFVQNKVFKYWIFWFFYVQYISLTFLSYMVGIFTKIKVEK